MMRASEKSIRKKISRMMTIQACLIAVVATLGIITASVVIEQLLVKKALVSEAEHFWQNYQKGKAFPTPNTANLKGYLTHGDSSHGLPEDFIGYSSGYHKLPERAGYSLLFVDQRADETLYLLFDGRSVGRLALYFGILPLLISLLLIYICAWWVYRQSGKVLSPILWLAKKFEKFDPAHPDATQINIGDIPGDIDWEIEKLSYALDNYSRRIKNFVERERTFTRDASHEFRTPLTVIRMATDILNNDQALSDKALKSVDRIKRAATDMEELIQAFLLLAREIDNEFEEQDVSINRLVKEELAKSEELLKNKQLKVNTVDNAELVISSSEKVLSIVIGNLLRNAIMYTEQGTVELVVNQDNVQINDTGVGISEQHMKKIFQPHYRAEHGEREGYGVGLAIVKRLSDRFNWPVSIDSEVGKGTQITIKFL